MRLRDSSDKTTHSPVTHPPTEQGCPSHTPYLRTHKLYTFLFKLKMSSDTILVLFFGQILLQLCLSANVPRVSPDDLDTITTDQLSFSETHNDQEPIQVSEEPPEYLVEWEDYEDPINNCNLTSYQENYSATYQCQDGTMWTVSVEQAGEDLCIYTRSITSVGGESQVKKTAVKCAIAKEWMQDLIQYEVLSGVPDMFLFDSDKIINNGDSEASGVENVPSL